MKVLCDIDGVIADSMTPLRVWAWRNYKTLIPASLPEYNPMVGGRPLAAIAGEAMTEPDFIGDCLPMEDGLDMLESLLKADIEVIFATARPAATLESTIEWLSENTWAREPRVYLSGHSDKGCLAEIGDVLIDDSVAQLASWSKTGKPCFLMPRPWNTSMATCWNYIQDPANAAEQILASMENG